MGFWGVISNSSNWWSKIEPDMSEDAPFIFKNYMSKLRFEVILLSLCYTSREDFEYNHGFFYISQIEDAFNTNISDEFNTSLIDVLGKKYHGVVQQVYSQIYVHF